LADANVHPTPGQAYGRQEPDLQGAAAAIDWTGVDGGNRVRAFVAIAAAGMVLAQPGPALALAARTVPFDLGDDSSEWAFDGECDDPRFVGEGMADYLLTDSIGADATDCRAAYILGTIEADPHFLEPASPKEILWGDDGGEFANDGVCEDVRFTGYFSADLDYLAEDIGHDASDCRAMFVSGRARWRGAALD